MPFEIVPYWYGADLGVGYIFLANLFASAIMLGPRGQFPNRPSSLAHLPVKPLGISTFNVSIPLGNIKFLAPNLKIISVTRISFPAIAATSNPSSANKSFKALFLLA